MQRQEELAAFSIELGGLPLEVWDHVKYFLDFPSQLRFFATNSKLASLKDQKNINLGFIRYLEGLYADSAKKNLPLYRQTPAYQLLQKKFTSLKEMSDEEAVIFALTREMNLVDLTAIQTLINQLEKILKEKKISLSNKTELHLELIILMLHMCIDAGMMDTYNSNQLALSVFLPPFFSNDILVQFKSKLDAYLANKTQDRINYLNLSGANFSNFDSVEQNLRDWNFTGANLAYASFVRSNAERVNFSNTNLYKANFSGANIDSANFPLSVFYSARFRNMKNVLPLIEGSFYSRANLNFDEFKKEFHNNVKEVECHSDLYEIFALNTVKILSNIEIDLKDKIAFLKTILLTNEQWISGKVGLDLPAHIEIFDTEYINLKEKLPPKASTCHLQ